MKAILIGVLSGLNYAVSDVEFLSWQWLVRQTAQLPLKLTTRIMSPPPW